MKKDQKKQKTIALKMSVLDQKGRVLGYDFIYKPLAGN